MLRVAIVGKPMVQAPAERQQPIAKDFRASVHRLVRGP